MPIDKDTARHLCNVIRRQIEAAYPDMTMQFILHNNKNKKESIKIEEHQILVHPAGKNFIEYINNSDHVSLQDKRSKFIGLSTTNRNFDLFRMFRKKPILAIFFINIDHFDDQDSYKNQVINLIWHALSVRDDYIKRENNVRKSMKKNLYFGEKTYEIDKNIIRPRLTHEILYERNLMADIFAATLQYFDGNQNALYKLALQRMYETITPKKGFIAERHPYPVSLETIEFIFQNSKFKKQNNIQTLFSAVSLAREIGKKYTIPATKHWRSFSLPAQHMAWMGYTPETILGTAIYTSENPYVRTIADHIASMTKIEPEIITFLPDYNPYLRKEETIQMHERLCMNTFQKYSRILAELGDTSSIKEEIKKQNQRLMLGNPFGWCVEGLLKILQAHENEFNPFYDEAQTARAEEIFKKAQSELPFDYILRLSLAIFQKRREGNDLSIEDVLALTKGKAEFDLIRNALTISIRSNLYPSPLQKMT